MNPVDPGVPGGAAAPFTVEAVGNPGDPHGNAGDLNGPAGLVRLHFFVPRRSVSFTRFILEGYDHLGVQTSDPGSSHVTWTVPAALRGDAEHLLADLLTKIK